MEQRFVVRSEEDFGRAVAELRLQRGWSQAQLAELAGLDRTRVARLEGNVRTKALDHLLRLLRRLGATVTITFDDEDGHGTA